MLEYHEKMTYYRYQLYHNLEDVSFFDNPSILSGFQFDEIAGLSWCLLGKGIIRVLWFPLVLQL